jgi:hypothetical protein
MFVNSNLVPANFARALCRVGPSHHRCPPAGAGGGLRVRAQGAGSPRSAGNPGGDCGAPSTGADSGSANHRTRNLPPRGRLLARCTPPPRLSSWSQSPVSQHTHRQHVGHAPEVQDVGRGLARELPARLRAPRSARAAPRTRRAPHGAAARGRAGARRGPARLPFTAPKPYPAPPVADAAAAPAAAAAAAAAGGHSAAPGKSRRP